MGLSTFDPVVMARLRVVLAALFESKVRARMLVEQAGLDPRQIDLDGEPDVRWFLILTEAQNHQKVSTLVEIAVGQYPAHGELRAVAALLPRDGVVPHTTGRPLVSAVAQRADRNVTTAVTVDALDDAEVLLLATTLVAKAADPLVNGQLATEVRAGGGGRIVVHVNQSAIRVDQLVQALHSDVELIQAYSERIAFLEKQVVGLCSFAFDFGAEVKKVEKKRSETYAGLRRNLRTFCDHLTREECRDERRI